jgi:hypothetical protein
MIYHAEQMANGLKCRIGEKHLEWSDPRHPIPLETILAMTTFYWFTSTFPRALYHAELVKNVLIRKPHPISKAKPLGYSLFPHDLVLLPQAWAREIYPNLVAYKTHDKVSHHFLFFVPWVIVLGRMSANVSSTGREDISVPWNSQASFWGMSRSLWRR